MKTASENIRDIDDLHHTLCCQRHQDHTCGAGLELCWTCRLALLASMRTLAANLRDAGALCAAFELGDEHGCNPRFAMARSWRPNTTGRAVPGWRK